MNEQANEFSDCFLVPAPRITTSFSSSSIATKHHVTKAATITTAAAAPTVAAAAPTDGRVAATWLVLLGCGIVFFLPLQHPSGVQQSAFRVGGIFWQGRQARHEHGGTVADKEKKGD